MLILCFIIPFIACLILFLGFRQAVIWWEYLILIIPSIVLTLILYLAFKYTGITDIEYLGYYVAKTSYYEPWNEYIHQTCTREIEVGKDRDGNPIYETEHYDCSYVEYHREEWTMTNNVGREIHISEDLYNKICKKLGTKKRFVDMHRHYHTIDGDKYECHFNGDRNRMWTLTSSHHYKNKILKSKSIFNYSNVSEQDKKEYRLFDYPDYSYEYGQNPIMSEVSVPKAVIDSFKYLNAYYGIKYQFRTYVMIWKNAPMETALLQEAYFVGGNKNELCICISVDAANQIRWIQTFSWEDKPYLETEINHLFPLYGEKLDLMRINRYLLKNVPQKWHRKAFADFEYINIMLEPQHWVIIIISIILFNILVSVYVVLNEYTENNPDGIKRKYYYR